MADACDVWQNLIQFKHLEQYKNKVKETNKDSSKQVTERKQWNDLQGVPQTNEPRHDKTNKISVRPAKTQISLGIRPVWSESSLSAWRNLGSLATHWAHSEVSDQIGQMPRLIWVFAERTLILLVLSCRGSYRDPPLAPRGRVEPRHDKFNKMTVGPA